MSPLPKHTLHAFVTRSDNSPTSENNEPSSNEDIIMPNANNANHALKILEKQIDSTSPTVFVKYRPQFEKVGAMVIKDGSASKARYEFQKLLKHTNHLNEKIIQTEKAFATWINTFESDDIFDFASEFEKFMKMHYQFNKTIGAQLEIITTSFNDLINSEAERNTQMNKYLKSRIERDEFKKKNLDTLALNKYEDKVILSYSSVVTSQMLYEMNVQRQIRPATFAYCNSIWENSIKLMKLCEETSLDLKEYTEKLQSKNPYREFHQNVSEININSTKNLNNNLFETMMIQRPSRQADDNILKGMKKLKLERANDNYENFNGSSDFESEPEPDQLQEHYQDEVYLFNTNPYDSTPAESKNYKNTINANTIVNNKARYRSPLFKQTTVLNNNEEYRNTLQRAAPLTKRDIPNDANNFDSTENYITFGNDKSQKNTRIKHADPLINDNLASELWK